MSRQTSLLFVTAILGATASCWTGADAEGLPCETNAHCGRGQECIDGYCGGTPAASLCGNGVVDPGEDCDDGEQNAEDGACRPDCTPETCGDGVLGPTEDCDEGQQNDNMAGCKLDCTPQACGDGYKGPSEPCDDGNNENGDGCSSTCVLESCGNGEVDPGEDCDDAGESADCDDDCTQVVCGDENTNEAAGEECDNDMPAVDDGACMSNCTVPLLWDDMEPNSPEVDWTHAKVSGDAAVTDTWNVTSRNPDGGSARSWDSGIPGEKWGDTRLMTPSVDLSGLGGFEIQLRFDHARRFVDCDQPTTPFEGAVVEVSVSGGPYVIVVPDDGYSEPIGDGMCPGEENPLAGQDGFTLDATYTTETVDLSEFAGSPIEVGFRVGWDCGNCPGDEEDRGWFIDNVVVWKK